jgi:methionyl-tRNA synthetase
MLEGRQFSKSEGWTIDLEDFFKKYSVDQIRYMIAASAPESQDSEFTWKEFQMRCNAELLGKLGNFVHRVITFTNQHLGGKVPSNASLRKEDQDVLEKLTLLAHEASNAYSCFSLRKATSLLMDIASLGNVYFDHQKPWALKKDPQKQNELEACIYTCLEVIRIMALVALPLIPDTAFKILGFLSQETSVEKPWDTFIKQTLKPDTLLKTPEILFRKIEDAEIEQEILKLKTMSEAAVQEDLVSIEDFKKMDIGIATVIQVESIPGSDKLYKLLVDDGKIKRQIVAGLKEVTTESDLLGKQVLVLKNLEKAVIRGVESNGMILALKEGKHLKALVLDGFKLGAKLS